MPKTPKDQDEYPEKEAAKRRDKALERMLNTPPKPHKESKGGRGGPERPPRKSKSPDKR